MRARSAPASTPSTLTSLHETLAAGERPGPAFEPVRGLPRSGVHWVEPTIVAQVGFSEWTADGELRHPRFQGLRRDKGPAEVVRETPPPERNTGARPGVLFTRFITRVGRKKVNGPVHYLRERTASRPG